MGKINATFLPALLASCLISVALSAIATVEVLYLSFSLSANYSMIGSVLGLSAVSLLLFSPMLQKGAHRAGYGLFLVWSSLLLACASIAASLAFSAGSYILPKVVIALFSPLTIPIVIELVRESFRFAKDLDRMLVTLIVATTFSGALGAVGAGFLATQHGLSYAYVFAGIAFFLSGMIALFLPRTSPPHVFANIPLNPVVRLSYVLKKPFFLLVLIAFSLQAYWAVRDFILPLVIIESGGSVLQVGWVFGAMSVLAGVGALFARRLLYKNDPKRVLVVLLGVGAMFALLLPFGPLIMIGIVASGFSFSESSANPAIFDGVEKNAPKKSSHLIFEGMRAVSALAWILTPVVLGLLLEAGMPARMVLFFAGLGMLYVYVRVQRAFSPEDIFPRLSVKRKKRLSW